MNQAIGLIEVKGYATAIDIADVCVKVAAVALIGIQRAKGFGWMTVEVRGDVGAVKAAVDAAKARAAEADNLISALVIPRPANGLDNMLLTEMQQAKAVAVEKIASELIIEEEKKSVALDEKTRATTNKKQTKKTTGGSKK
jgi:microcompartment protein CcmL/EutN